MKVQPNPQPCGGGICSPRDVRNYSPPVGPKGLDHNSPGLGGMNHGNSGTQRHTPMPRGGADSIGYPADRPN
jgi:hypothetical protein